MKQVEVKVEVEYYQKSTSKVGALATTEVTPRVGTGCPPYDSLNLFSVIILASAPA